MMIAYSTKPWPELSWTLAAKLATLPGGDVSVIFPDGQVLSVQPDGSQQKRPAGAAGPYERARLAPQGLVYCPNPPTGQVYVFAYVPAVPNV